MLQARAPRQESGRPRAKCPRMRYRILLPAIVLCALAPAPARATHGCLPDRCEPVSVAFHGLMTLCAPAGLPERCEYTDDAIWNGPADVAQGLYSVGLGPPARGPVTMRSGPGIAPLETCAALEGPGFGLCRLDLVGAIDAVAGAAGAYCEAWATTGTLRIWHPGPLLIEAEVTFARGAVAGTVARSSPAGYEGASVAGAFHARPAHGDCGVTEPLTALIVAGTVHVA